MPGQVMREHCSSLGMSERATGEVRWRLRAASVRAWLALAGALIRAGIRGWTVNR